MTLIKFKSPLKYYKEDWNEPLPDYEASCEFTEMYVRDIVVPKLEAENKQLREWLEEIKGIADKLFEYDFVIRPKEKESISEAIQKPDNWQRGELQEPLVLLTPTERVIMPKGCTISVMSSDEWLHNTTDEAIDEAAKKMMTEKEKVKQLGEQLGYGQMMKLASELWKKDMIAHGYPTSGVFIPALKSDVKSK